MQLGKSGVSREKPLRPIGIINVQDFGAVGTGQVMMLLMNSM